MWLKGEGKIVYNPHRPGMKKIRRLTPWWIVVNVDRGLGEYYRHWINKRFGLILQQPTWGPHITITNDKDSVEPEFQPYWKKYAGQKIQFEYSVEIEQHWKFWVLPVRCEKFDLIRKELGIVRNHPFHITIGRMD